MEGVLKLAKKYTADEVKEMILDVSSSLFVSKGYEKTSIQDIVKGLDGLSRGAIYHHFESKQAIINGVVRRFVPTEEELDNIATAKGLSGLEKIQKLLIDAMFNQKRSETLGSSYELLNDAIFFSLYITTMTEILSPYIEMFIEEGHVDGSVSAPFPRQIAEVIIMLISTWFINALYPNTDETFWEKLSACQYVLKQCGVDVLSKEVLQTIMSNVESKVKEYEDKSN